MDLSMAAHGFRRSGMVWNRTRPGMIHVLSVQTGKRSSRLEIDFTINIGVLLESVWQAIQNRPLPKIVQEVDCFPRLRVGHLLDEGPLHKDVWWALRVPDDIDVAGTEVRNIVNSKCIPFLNRIDSSHMAMIVAEDPTLRKHPAEKLSYAALQYLTGQCCDANDSLSEMLADPRLKGWHEQVREVSERLATWHRAQSS